MRFLWLIFISLTSYAQLAIDYPVDRMVIQRNNDNTAWLQITGGISQPTDSVQARLVPVQAGQGTLLDWQTISRNPENGYYWGRLRAFGGWYRLEVKSFFSGIEIAKGMIEHVGIGEVFIVSGQSNAEGNLDFEGATLGTTEDRVSSINFKDAFFRLENIPFEFTPLRDNSQMGPYNSVPWLWATMAEKIVQKHNVPVLLLGAAVGGTSSQMWYDSMLGNNLQVDFGSIVKFEGSPYGVIQKTLQHYVSRTGARALLWQQGESDFYTDVFTYFERIKRILEKTQKDIEAPLAWVIAQGSRTPNPTSIHYAQSLLIQNLDYAFQGPDTDLISGPENRADGIHFHKEGIKKAGEAWFQAIAENDLFQKITPIEAKNILLPKVNCNTSAISGIRLFVDCCFDKIEWSDGQATDQPFFTTGIQKAKAIRNGISYFSPGIFIDPVQFITPQISISGETEFCEGENSLVLGGGNAWSEWTNGWRTSEIKPEVSGSYGFVNKNLYGCLSASEKVQVNVKPKPKFDLKFDTGAPSFCEGSVLIVSTQPTFSQYFWNNNINTPANTFSSAGTYTLQVMDDAGCLSDLKSFTTEVLNRPQQPVIQRISPFTLSVQQTDANGYNWFDGNQILQSGASEFRIQKEGNYFAQSYSNYERENATITCISEPSATFSLTRDELGDAIRFYPNPAKEQLTIETLETIGTLHATILNLRGQQLSSDEIELTDKKGLLPLPDLPEGTYILKIGSRSNFVESKLHISQK